MMILCTYVGVEGADGRLAVGGTSISQRLGLSDGVYRPGLSAGISGAGFQLENDSVASTASRGQQGATGGASRDQDNR